MSETGKFSFQLPAIHREGHAFIGIAGAVTLVLFFISDFLGVIGLLLTFWVIWFFRDPSRITPVRDGLAIAPADGMVLSVGLAEPPPELELGTEPRHRIAIVLSLFDVHINRAPADGTLEKIVYTPGAFLNPALEKASEDNERMAYRVKTDSGKTIAFVQIAGIIPRRIVRWVEEGEAVKAGQRVGMIRFGSRVDLYLDDGLVPLVAEGQKMIAGETVIADEQAFEIQRWGEQR